MHGLVEVAQKVSSPCWLVWTFPLDRAASYQLMFDTGADAQQEPTFTPSQLTATGSGMTYQIAEFPNGLAV